MNRDEALEFLWAHQPMPPDREMSRETMERYEQVRLYFLANPDTACVRPFLRSFGDGDGFGVYELIGDVFREIGKKDVIDGLRESLASRHRSVRYWSAQLAAAFPAPELVPSLLRLLKEDDHDLQYAALTAIEQSADHNVVPHLEMFCGEVKDEELVALAEDVVKHVRAE